METARLISLICEAELMLHQNASAPASWREAMLDLRRQMLADYESRGVPAIADAVLGLRAAADVVDAITPEPARSKYATRATDMRLGPDATIRDLELASDRGMMKDLRRMADTLETDGWAGKRAAYLWPLWYGALTRFFGSFIPLAVEMAVRGLPLREKPWVPRGYGRYSTEAERLAQLRWRLHIESRNLFPDWTEKIRRAERAEWKARARNAADDHADRGLPPGTALAPITAVATRLGVTRSTVQRYVKEGLLIPAFRTAGGQARFTSEQVEQLLCPEKSEKSLGSLGSMVRRTASGTPSGMTRPSDGRSASRFIRELQLKHRLGLRPGSRAALNSGKTGKV
jgi:excisionase family DNA binding protein